MSSSNEPARFDIYLPRCNGAYLVGTESAEEAAGKAFQSGLRAGSFEVIPREEISGKLGARPWWNDPRKQPGETS